MSRLEENTKFIDEIEKECGRRQENPEDMSMFFNILTPIILMDISRSLAMITDVLKEEQDGSDS